MNLFLYVYIHTRHPSAIEGDLMLTVLHFVIRAVSESSAAGISPETKEPHHSSTPLVQHILNVNVCMLFSTSDLCRTSSIGEESNTYIHTYIYIYIHI